MRYKLKIGIAQIPMYWTVKENTETICKTITDNQDVDVIVFPELAITGFHRSIKEETQASLITAALDKISVQCLESNTLTFVGHPFIKNNKIYNAYSAINEQGNIDLVWKKVGLTPSEATFFEAGVNRTVLNHPLGSFSSIFCREASDVNLVVGELLSKSPSYIIWPSYIGDAKKEKNMTDINYDLGTKSIAKQLSAKVIQCNWAHSLNEPSRCGLGGSKIFSTNGDITAQLPFDECCIGIFDTIANRMQIRNKHEFSEF